MTDLHLAGQSDRRCLWCGSDTVECYSTQDRETWKASPQSCRVSHPVTLTIFGRDEGQFSRQGFDPDAIQITNEVLAERSQNVKALVQSEGAIWQIEQPDLRRTAFTWSPTLTSRVAVEELSVTPTFHSCGYYGFFKPSIAEVLAQLPEGIDANAFYIDDDSLLVCQQGDGHLVKTHWVRIRED